MSLSASVSTTSSSGGGGGRVGAGPAVGTYTHDTLTFCKGNKTYYTTVYVSHMGKAIAVDVHVSY